MATTASGGGGRGRRVFVAGVGMTKFEKPGSRPNFDYPDMAKEAVHAALHDAGISYADVQQVCVGYVYGDSTCGQRAVYHSLGHTGVPIHNVNNNCATGSTALFLAQQLIAGGLCDCVLALGFEKMNRGSIQSVYSDRTNPLDRHVSALSALHPISPTSPIAAQFFAAAGREHMEKYGTKPEHFAKIAWKNHLHSTRNPLSQFQAEFSVDQILESRCVSDFLTVLQCCPTSDGAASAVLVSERFLDDRRRGDRGDNNDDRRRGDRGDNNDDRRHGNDNDNNAVAVEIAGIAMATDTAETFSSGSRANLVGYQMTHLAAERALRMSGLSIRDVQVIELHDCFSANELICYEALGLCPPGGAGALIDRGDTTYGGRWVVNPSGGLISKGHPLGATGLAQCAELCWQLRGQAGGRQVEGSEVALQHNLGLGGAAVVVVYRRRRHGNRGTSVSAVSPPPSPVSPRCLRGVSAVSPDPEGFQSLAVFKEIADRLEQDGESLARQLRSVYEFRVRGSGDRIGVWTVDVKTGAGGVSYWGETRGGDTGETRGVSADVTLSISDEDLVSMMSGKLNPQMAFFQGRMKVTGNVGLALKLQSLIKSLPSSKL